jgi:hypothetical protein
MTAFIPPRKAQLAEPPARGETFQTLDRNASSQRRPRSGRTDQFNARVKPGFKERVEQHAGNERETIGSMLEIMMTAYENGAAAADRGVPIVEARAGRTRPVRLWVSEAVYNALAKIAGERNLTVSQLFEDLLAREVARLDPHGGRFGVAVKTTA